MTHNQNPGAGVRKLGGTMLIVSLAAVLVAAGAAYSLGIFSQSEPEAKDPLRITLSSDRLDFGDLALQDRATRQLILRNDGDEPLTADILVNDSDLKVRPERLILHPGVGSRVMVEFFSKSERELDDELQVVVDRAGTDPLVVALAGRVWHDPSEMNARAERAARRAIAERRNDPPSQPATIEFPVQEPWPEEAEATEAEPDSGTITVADASVTRREADRIIGGGSTATVNTSSRRPTASGSNPPEAKSPGSDKPASRNRSTAPMSPANLDTNIPYRSLSERPPMVPDQISEQEASKASKIPSKVAPGEDGEELPDRLPDEPYDGDDVDDDDSRRRDVDDKEDDDPFVSPTLIISGQSSVRVMGGSARFYPQTIGVLGTDMGGLMSLAGPLEFPVVPLAFGESMLFAELGAGASGGWDAMSGQVTLQVPIQAVDADGDAAPMNLVLTTGTAMERNESGNVVAFSGTPRNPGTGLLRLVGLAKIPVGYRNGGEEHLAIFEILASLTFGTSISSSDPAPIGRIGG